jgi:ribulose-phosphate 3-epimerase
VLWNDRLPGVEVAPSLYAADFSRLGEQVQELLDVGVRIFHFDVGDGHFVPPVTVGPIVLQWISPLVHRGGGLLDCHLMVEHPERHFPAFAEAGGDSVTFHVEAVTDPAAAIALARGLGLAVGVAFNPETTVETAASAAADADVALCMGVHPGYSGQAFIPETLPRVEQLRAALPPEVHVEVDGGVGLENVRALREAGARILVVGSSLFGEDDPIEAYRALAAAAGA